MATQKEIEMLMGFGGGSQQKKTNKPDVDRLMSFKPIETSATQQPKPVEQPKRDFITNTLGSIGNFTINHNLLNPIQKGTDIAKKTIDIASRIPGTPLNLSRNTMDYLARPGQAITTAIYNANVPDNQEKSVWGAFKTNLWDSKGQEENVKRTSDIIKANPTLNNYVGRDETKPFYNGKNLLNSAVSLGGDIALDPTSWIPIGALGKVGLKGVTAAEKGITKIGSEIAPKLESAALKTENKLMPKLIKPITTTEKLKPLIPTESIRIPKLTPTSEVGTRSFTQTVKGADLTTPDIAKVLENEEYKVLHNQNVLDFAKKYVTDNPEAAYRLVKSPQPATAESNAIAQELIRQSQNAGRFEDAIDLIETVSKKATESGQAVQALSMWGRLTPEGMLRHAQRVFDNANKLNPKLNLKLDNDFVDYIVTNMNKINKMAEGRAKVVATRKVLTTIEEKVPAGILKKTSSVQTLFQLLNPKTFIRNIGGNAAFSGIENVSDVVGTGIDKAVSFITKQRAKVLPNLKEQFKGFKKGFKLGMEDVREGIDTSNVGTQFELNDRSMFNSKIMKKAEKALNYSLRVPDRAFYESTYQESLRQQKMAAKVTKATREMEEIAHHDALYRTFQDENAATKAFQLIKRGLNLGKEFGFGDLVLKYPKTPANLLMRSVEYSPAGFIKSVIEMAKPLAGRAFNQKAFVETTSRALVGTTSLMGMGYILNKLGIITGKREKDTEAANMLQNVGIGGYKFNTSALKRFVLSGFDPSAAKIQEGDNLISYDWLQPMAVGLAMGANIADNKVKGSFEAVGMLDSIMQSIQEGTNTLAEQSLLRNLTDLFKGNKDLFQVVVDTVKGAPASFIPTFVNQIRQITDNTRRDAYSKEFSTGLKKQVINKIPFVSRTLEPSLSTLGKEQQIYQNPSLFNVFLNPAFTTQYKPTPIAKMVIELFDQTGETKQFPRFVKDSFLANKEQVKLNPQEKTQLQEIVGEKTIELLTPLVDDAYFINSTPEDQIKQIYDLLNEAGEYGKNAIKEQKGLPIKRTLPLFIN